MNSALSLPHPFVHQCYPWPSLLVPKINHDALSLISIFCDSSSSWPSVTEYSTENSRDMPADAETKKRCHGDRSQNDTAKKKRRFGGDRWSASICSDDDVIALATSYHASGLEPQFFKKPISGAYNLCFFVEFPAPKRGAPKDRWVIRVPTQTKPGFGRKEKMEKEVETMRLVSLA